MTVDDVAGLDADWVIDQLGIEIKKDFVGTGENPGEVFAAYAGEHGQNTRA